MAKIYYLHWNFELFVQSFNSDEAKTESNHMYIRIIFSYKT